MKRVSVRETETMSKLRDLLRSIISGTKNVEPPKAYDTAVTVIQTTPRKGLYHRCKNRSKTGCSSDIDLGITVDAKTYRLINHFRDECGVTTATIVRPLFKTFLNMYKGILDQQLPLCRDDQDVENVIVNLLNIPLVY